MFSECVRFPQHIMSGISAKWQQRNPRFERIFTTSNFVSYQLSNSQLESLSLEGSCEHCGSCFRRIHIMTVCTLKRISTRIPTVLQVRPSQSHCVQLSYTKLACHCRCASGTHRGTTANNNTTACVANYTCEKSIMCHTQTRTLVAAWILLEWRARVTLL